MIGKSYLFAKSKFLTYNQTATMLYKLQFFLAYLSIRILTLNYFAIRRIINNFLKTGKYHHVLDFGCGIGILAPLFTPKQYLGFDIDTKAIAYAKNKYPKYSFQVGDATKLKLQKKFDLILIVGVLHHLNNKEVKAALEVIKSLLLPKGKVILIEAIPPIHKWNILGHIFRSLDKGHYVRALENYQKLVDDSLAIEKQYQKMGGVLDYGIFIIRHKTDSE